MNNLQSIQEEINQLTNLQLLVKTFESIAVIFTKRIRQSVIDNRAFYAGLARIFEEVTYSYRKEMKNLLEKDTSRKAAGLTLLKKNGKSIAVLLSVNTGLYGNIVQETFRYFLEDIKKQKTIDILIVGAVGKALFEEALPKRKFEYTPLPESETDSENFESIRQYLEQYQDVIVFFGEFKNFLSLKPSKKIISGELELGNQHIEEDKSFLFEPSLEQVVVFFETEIFASLLTQLFYESRLAKLTSRMLLLNQASINIDSSLDKTHLTEQKMRHQIMNKKQLEITTSIIAQNL